MLNGNWRDESRVHHYCNGCCASERDAREKCVRAALDLLVKSKPQVPALNRWGKQAAALGFWLQGILCHGIFKRAFRPVTESLEEMLEMAPDEYEGGMRDMIDFLKDVVPANLDQESAWKTEFKKRRAAGHAFLTNAQDNIALASCAIALDPLTLITAGLMGDVPETRPIP